MTEHDSQRRSGGFTMVELIVVILILGILAALALPKFINMGADARLAKINSIYGSVRAAAQVTYAASLVRSNTGATGSVTTQSGSVTTVYGYPDITSSGIAFAAGLDTSATNADQVTIDTTTTSGTMYISPVGAGTAASCRIAYTPAASSTTSPTISLTASLANC